MSSAIWVFDRENAEIDDTAPKKAFGLSFDACTIELYCKSTLDPSCEQHEVWKEWI